MQVTRLAREMVIRWGMSPKVGPLNYSTAPEQATLVSDKPYSEATAKLIDEEVHRIVEECAADAERLLREHRPQLDALAHALLDEDTLNEADVLRVTGLEPARAASSITDQL
jgi:cell division protease FtsH